MKSSKVVILFLCLIAIFGISFGAIAQDPKITLKKLDKPLEPAEFNKMIETALKNKGIKCCEVFDDWRNEEIEVEWQELITACKEIIAKKDFRGYTAVYIHSYCRALEMEIYADLMNDIIKQNQDILSGMVWSGSGLSKLLKRINSKIVGNM